jgi:hypothetical protein
MSGAEKNGEPELDPEIYHDAGEFESESIEVLADYKKKKSTILTIGLPLLAVVAVLALRNLASLTLPMILGFGGIAAMGFFLNRAYSPVREFKNRVKTEFGNRVLAHYGRQMKLQVQGINEGEFRYAVDEIAPSYDRYRSEDLITGIIKGTDFKFYEVELEEERKHTDSKGNTTTTYVTVFKGFVVSIHLNRQYRGNIRISADSALNRLFSKDRVRLESMEFEKLFDVHADDQISSRTILTPLFMEKLTELALSPAFQSNRHKGLFGNSKRPAFQATIKNDYINLMIRSNTNKFEVDDDGKQVHLKGFARAIQEDMKAITYCIEGLKLEQD